MQGEDNVYWISPVYFRPFARAEVVYARRIIVHQIFLPKLQNHQQLVSCSRLDKDLPNEQAAWLFVVVVTCQRFVKEPENPAKAKEGEEVGLTWKFDLEDSTFRLMQWIFEREGSSSTTIAEMFSLLEQPDIYDSRFSVNASGGNTTLILSNVSRTDAEGTFKCELTYKPANEAPQKLKSKAIRLDVLCKYVPLWFTFGGWMALIQFIIMEKTPVELTWDLVELQLKHCQLQ